MEAFCQHKLSHQAMYHYDNEQWWTRWKKSTLHSLQLFPQLLREEEFVIGTMWNIRSFRSAVIIFMLGFIADAFTLHLRADNEMRISPPHRLCSFNP